MSPVEASNLNFIAIMITVIGIWVFIITVCVVVFTIIKLRER